jgi:hypothetical protein
MLLDAKRDLVVVAGLDVLRRGRRQIKPLCELREAQPIQVRVVGHGGRLSFQLRIASRARPARRRVHVYDEHELRPRHLHTVCYTARA